MLFKTTEKAKTILAKASLTEDYWGALIIAGEKRKVFELHDKAEANWYPTSAAGLTGHRSIALSVQHRSFKEAVRISNFVDAAYILMQIKVLASREFSKAA